MTIRHQVDLSGLGDFCGRPGCTLEIAICIGHPVEGLVCATFYWSDGSFTATNNMVDEYSNDLKKTFPATEQGARIAANWFICEEEKAYKQRKAQEAKARREKRRAKRERDASLKGGLGNGNPFAALKAKAA